MPQQKGSDEELKTPSYWLARADEARSVTARLRDPEAIQTMQVIAQAYGRMARRFTDSNEGP